LYQHSLQKGKTVRKEAIVLKDVNVAIATAALGKVVPVMAEEVLVDVLISC
jgi:hypothetical protein